MANVSVPCGSCSKPVRSGDEFCEACGAKVTRELKSALGDQDAAAEWTVAAHAKKAERAQKTIGALAILFAIGAVALFFITRSQVDKTLGQLAGASDTDPLAQAVAGADTVGRLRAALERRPWEVAGGNVFLAVVMAGIWQWSKRALLPAAVTALGIYVAAIAASAIYDPATLVSGVAVKIIIIVALACGVKSAAAVRRVELTR